MDKRLETYLQTVEIGLGGLEAEKRASELREMRQHIEAIVARLVEGGLNENEATEAAIAQFGGAHKVGRELSKVPHKRDSREKIAAAVGGALLCWIIPSLFAVFSQSLEVWLGQMMCFTAALTSGAVATRIAPHDGKRAVLWLLGFFLAVEPVIGLVDSIQIWLANQSPDFLSLIFHNWHNNFMTLVIFLLIWLGATIGSRRTENCDLTHA